MNDKLLKIDNYLWETDIYAQSPLRALPIKAFRIAYVVIRDMLDGQLTLRAMSLVYTTLLSLVPLIAVSFSVLKGFGVHNQIEPILLNLLAPLGDKSIEITQKIIGFVENIKVGVLGSLGLFLLLYTVVALIQKIERSFNYTWHVTRVRPITQRLSDYLSVVLVGPVLIFSAMGITATVTGAEFVQTLSQIEPFGKLIGFVGTMLPYMLVIVAFTFIYTFVPNVKVKIKSALVGALVAGVLWESMGWIFASFVVNSTKYTAIYSAFATLIMFMIWLYLSWLILLVGASIAFYHQHPEHLTRQQHTLMISNRLKELIALQVMYLVASRFYHHQEPWSVDGLSRRMAIPMGVMESVVSMLETGALLKATDADPRGFVPAQPLELTKIKDVLDVIRSADESQYLNPARVNTHASVQQALDAADDNVASSLDNRSLQDLLLASIELDDGVNIVRKNFERERQ